MNFSNGFKYLMEQHGINPLNVDLWATYSESYVLRHYIDANHHKDYTFNCAGVLLAEGE